VTSRRSQGFALIVVVWFLVLIAAIGIIFRGTAYALRSQLEDGEGRAGIGTGLL